ncbi:conserved Plasmodium protein, unknown function [Plasmodium sp. gorilla clade G2]|uniref:conserved Plasmodium protein, unknown function n=1 Tax=Plasmodium sp. gorilla clade G2 TaxID=880535 RepID=UPI000D221BEA|nr:conserved Plasmodium protein, unknown function [Plasmodium sp. gorilla clade G2]SOV17981.1 conserved Plasmodium protein, unknown function [Plasmodium sp. gorilla clade G2]
MNNETKVFNKCFKKISNCYTLNKKGEKDNSTGKQFVLYNCIQTLLSDPIVVLYTDNNYICTGSLTGKVCLYKITIKENKETNTNISYVYNNNNITDDENKCIIDLHNRDELKKENYSKSTIDDVVISKKELNNQNNINNINNNNNGEIIKKYHILCMFRNNSIKSIYINKNNIYICYESCIDVFCVRSYQFLQKINLDVSNNKQVIYYENYILFNNSKSLFIYDITSNFSSYFYKNFLKNIVIFDFNINYLLCYKNNFGKCHIRVLQIFADAEKCEHELIFCVDFSSKFISHGKFLDDEKIIVAKNGKRLIIFDFKKAIDMYRIRKLKKKILDIHKSVENMLFILVENQIFIFNLSTFVFYKTVQLPKGLFYFKWSYFIRYKNRKIIFSSDKGVYYIDYSIEDNA